MNFPKIHHKRSPSRLFVISAALLIFASAGSYAVTRTFAAATTTPYGTANYCQLENGSTVIYGWGADAQATTLAQPNVTVTIGGKSVTVPTNIANFRDDAIEDRIEDDYEDDPTPGTYGFRAVFTGLYKDTTYPISGIIINVGAGSNGTMGRTTTTTVDGVPRHTFAGNVVPSACLATRPAAPAPSPTPTPTPTPPPPADDEEEDGGEGEADDSGSDTDSGSDSSGGDDSGDSGDSGDTGGSDDSGDSGDSDSSRSGSEDDEYEDSEVTYEGVETDDSSERAGVDIVAGTLAARLAIPTNGAGTIMVRHGVDSDDLANETEEVEGTGDTTVVTLTKLKAASKHYYEIVRDGQEPSGAEVLTFATKGYTLILNLSDKSGRPVTGLRSSLTDLKLKASSDTKGKVTYKNIPGGKHTLSYEYKGTTYAQEITADASYVSEEEADSPSAVRLNYFANVDRVTTFKAVSKKLPWPVLVIILLLLGGAAFVIVRRIRNRRQITDSMGDGTDNFFYDDPAVVTPAEQPPAEIPQTHDNPTVVTPAEKPPEKPPAPPPVHPPLQQPARRPDQPTPVQPIKRPAPPTAAPARNPGELKISHTQADPKIITPNEQPPIKRPPDHRLLK